MWWAARSPAALGSSFRRILARDALAERIAGTEACALLRLVAEARLGGDPGAGIVPDRALRSELRLRAERKSASLAIALVGAGAGADERVIVVGARLLVERRHAAPVRPLLGGRGWQP